MIDHAKRDHLVQRRQQISFTRQFSYHFIIHNSSKSLYGIINAVTSRFAVRVSDTLINR